ncbi:MAG: N-6 DNA methylase [Prevotellaceae bacterium]|nr:N-6 DNA methylase [Candidatus Colivivens equi]
MKSSEYQLSKVDIWRTFSMENGIKSEQRVKDIGEVFTPYEIVRDMVDLIDKSGKLNIEQTYLEPACGDGQFLIELLYRKLKSVIELPVEQRQLALVKAVCSIYGVDIQLDNVRESRRRMLDLIKGEETTSFTKDGGLHTYEKLDLGIEITAELEEVLTFVIKNNIKCGNTLTNRQYREGRKKEESTDEIDITSLEDDRDVYKIKLFATKYTFDGEEVIMTEEPMNEEADEMPLITGKVYKPIHYMSMKSRKENRNA